MLVKQDLINKVLLSIEGYNPIIEIDSTTLNNDEVHLFDKMYEVMGLIVQKYTNDDDEIILNLSSGTPQIISAFFALTVSMTIILKLFRLLLLKKEQTENTSL